MNAKKSGKPYSWFDGDLKGRPVAVLLFESWYLKKKIIRRPSAYYGVAEKKHRHYKGDKKNNLLKYFHDE